MSTILDWALLISVIASLAIFWKVSEPYRKRGVSGSKQLATEGPNMCVAEMVKSKPLEMYDTSKVRVVHENSSNSSMLYMRILSVLAVGVLVIYYVRGTHLFCS